MRLGGFLATVCGSIMAVLVAIGASLCDGMTAHRSSTAAAIFAPPPLRDLICPGF
jgi:hypothetical protein